MTPAQCRQARELLGWTEIQLARTADLKAEAVRYVQAGNGRPKTQTLAALCGALEVAGVKFIAESDGKEGVRLHQSTT